MGPYTVYFTFKDVEIDETVPLCCSNVFAFGRSLFLDLLFVFLTDVPKLIGFENKKSLINCFFFMTEVRSKGEICEIFSIKDFDLRLQKLCLIWVSISVICFLTEIKSPRLKLVWILLKS